MSASLARYPFKSAYRRRKHHFEVENFKLQEFIDATSGLIVEFAGPSRNGFYFLNSIKFPRNIEVTNKFHDGAFFEPSDQELARSYVKRLLDIATIKPLESSIGAALISCLDICDDEKFFSNKSIHEAVSQINNEIRELISGTLTKPVHSLRATFLNKAAQFIENEGLLIAEQLSKLEINYAQKLGFKTLAYNGISSDEDGSYYQSIVLRLFK